MRKLLISSKRALLSTILFCIFSSITTDSVAQSKVRGSVIDNSGAPAANANVLLLHGKDSSLVQGLITEKAGSYLFQNISPGKYIIATTFTGYKQIYTPVFDLFRDEDKTLPLLKLVEKDAALSEVMVVAKKPLFEQKIDRLVINVASSITNAGSTALDVLMRSPGISVNQQNNTLSINGKDGVFVMLNGKINRMPITALVQMLAGMNSSNIERIELITTPPANFDAEGNAGFINIVLKKNTQYGTNGSLSVTAGYGIGGGPVSGGSINFNHRKEKWNLYGDYSFSRIMPSSFMTSYRKVINGSNVIESFMNSDRDDFRRNHNVRLGLDHELNKKTVLGVLLSGFSNMYGMDAVNTSNIFSNGNLDTTIIINNPERHPLDNYSANFNIQHHLSKEQQLSVNLDYIFYRDANTLSYLNEFYRGNGSFIYSDKTKSNKETPIKFWVATVDYTKRIGKKTDMEAGVKATLSNFINDVRVEKEVQNNWIPDKDFTSKHNLEESIFAAYASFNIAISAKTKSKVGLRYEYTNSNLGSEIKKNIVDRHYGNWFPNLFLSHSVNDNSSFNFSYNRRITRPTFNDMAPFVYFIDPNTFFSGNPALQPSVANTVKWDYLFKRFIFSLSYMHEKNTITNFAPKIDPGNNKQTFAAENQKDRNIAALSISLPSSITKWWTMQNNITGEWQQLNAFYKEAPLTIVQRSFRFNSTQSFKLPKDYSLELNGNYQSAGFFGFYQMKSMLSLNFGAQKKLGPKGGTLIFNVTDFTGVPHFRLFVDAPEHNLVSDFDGRFTVTTLKLTYTRTFGNLKVKENRKRNTGSEEERQRVQSN